MKALRSLSLAAAALAIGSTAHAEVPDEDGDTKCYNFSFSGLASGNSDAANCHGSVKPPPGDSSVEVVNEIIDFKGWGFDVTASYKDNNVLAGFSDTFLIDVDAATRSVTFSQAISGAFALVLKTGSDWSVFNFSSGIGAGTLSYSIAGAGNYEGLGLSHATVYTEGPIAAIPEPETYALLVAGLGLMGFVASRRRPQQ